MSKELEGLREQHAALVAERNAADCKVAEALDANDRDAAQAAAVDLARLDPLMVKIARQIGQLEFDSGDTRFVAMSSSVRPPPNCRSKYRRVVVVETAQSWSPTMIHDTPRSRVVRDYGSHCVGSTERCTFAKAWQRAQEEAAELNAKAA